MGIQLKVTAAASVVSLAAGLLIGYFVSSSANAVDTVKTANEVERKQNVSEEDRKSVV